MNTSVMIDKPPLKKAFSISQIPAQLSEEVDHLLSCFNAPQSWIGIDLGTHSVKAVQYTFQNGQWRILKASLEEIQSPKESSANIIDALKKTLEGFSIKKSSLACIVNCPETVTRHLTVPLMPKEEIKKAVLWEVKNFIHFPIEEGILDFQVMGEVMERDVKKISVLVSISPKATIDRILDIFSKAGFKISKIMPLCLALSCIFKKMSFPGDETTAFLEMGELHAEFNIFSKGKLEFSRKFPVTGQQLTKSLTGVFSSERGRAEINTETAEKIKKNYGIPDVQDHSLIDGKISAQQIRAMLRPKLEQLIEEIGRSLDFYREGWHAEKVDRLILFGGAVKLKGLVEFLSQELGVEVRVGNVLEGNFFTEEGHRFQGALGCVLSQQEGINLLPMPVKEEKKRFIERLSWKSFVTFVVTILCVIYAGMYLKLAGYEKKRASLQMALNSLKPIVSDVQQNIQIEQMVSQKPLWEEIFREISHTLPPNMYLLELTMTNDVLTMRGKVLFSQQAVEEVLSNFMLDMEKGIFKNVRLVETRKTPEAPYLAGFEISCQID